MAQAASGTPALASGMTDAQGELDWSFVIPANPALSGAPVHLQALVFDPAGVPLNVGINAALTPALALTIGW